MRKLDSTPAACSRTTGHTLFDAEIPLLRSDPAGGFAEVQRDINTRVFITALFVMADPTGV